MLSFLEGLPGAGKSYDAVESFVLPALRAGRAVYTNLPLTEDLELWSAAGVDDLRLLHRLPEDVSLVDACVASDDGSLVVVDEAHGWFGSAGRAPLPPVVERWIAEHRHHGLDIVLITQVYKRLHAGLRGRAERLISMVRLGGVGLDSRARRIVSTQVAGRWERVSSSVTTYSPAIWALYQSHEIGVDAAATRAMARGGFFASRFFRVAALAVLIAVCWGVWSFLRAFDADGAVGAAQVAVQPASTARVIAAAAPVDQQQRAGVGDVAVVERQPPVRPLPPAQAYWWGLVDAHRLRLAGVASGAALSGIWCVIEVWQADQLVDRLTCADLRSIGLSVGGIGDGLIVRYPAGASGERSVYVSPWPLPDEDRGVLGQRSRLDPLGLRDGVVVPITRAEASMLGDAE